MNDLTKWIAKLDAYEAKAVEEAKAAGRPFPILDLHPDVCGIPVEIQHAIDDARRGRSRGPDPDALNKARSLEVAAKKAEGLAKMLDQKGGDSKGQRERAAALRKEAATLTRREPAAEAAVVEAVEPPPLPEEPPTEPKVLVF